MPFRFVDMISSGISSGTRLMLTCTPSTARAPWWFDRTKAVVPNHFIRLADGTPADDLPFALPPELAGRSTIAKKAQRVDVECIVRGYISGSA